MAKGDGTGPHKEGPLTGRGYGLGNNYEGGLARKGYGGLSRGEGYGPAKTAWYNRISEWYQNAKDSLSSLFGRSPLEKLATETK
ncbi:DUF5320 domain-containing protein [Candidatus Woesearchaeota archaeon]|nr:DUF5320 domain-containing protein [Candidatus Woesearchaeota archaeon]